MYLLLTAVLAVSAGCAVWRLLGRTGWRRPLRILLSVLAGVLAAHTTLPVIGIPIKSAALDGLDALLATVMMPKGIPVATVAIDGAANAAYLAIQILALSDNALSEKLAAAKIQMAEEVAAKDEKLQAEING